ncbi:MAG TPA: tetratricopeptide repeat protein [Vicinamibacterales bacterium]|nr:tetratricopeptide repeat protein [Vicinamibacterales bacterium]
MFAGCSRPLLAMATMVVLAGPPLPAQDDPYRSALETYRKGGDMELTVRALQGWRRDDFEKAIERFLLRANRDEIEAAAVLQLEFGLASVAQSASSAQFHLEAGMRIIRRLTAPYRSQSQFPPDLSGFIRTWLGVAASAFLTINDTKLARPWIDRAMSLPKSAPTTTLAGIVEEMAANAIDPTTNVRSRMDWRRRLAQAAEIYEQAIALDASYARAHVRLAHVLLRLDELPRSRSNADRALALAQEPVDRYLGALALGAGLERQGDLAGARDAYERALAAAPGAQTATVALGFVDMMAGRPQDAQARVTAFVSAPKDDLYWWEFRNGGVDHAGVAWLRARVGR